LNLSLFVNFKPAHSYMCFLPGESPHARRKKCGFKGDVNLSKASGLYGEEGQRVAGKSDDRAFASELTRRMGEFSSRLLWAALLPTVKSAGSFQETASGPCETVS
jgi:hypothetical protein